MMYPQVRGSQGEHTQVQDGLLDLSNKKRLGITEFHLVRQQGKSLTAINFFY
jgi:arginine kinase